MHHLLLPVNNFFKVFSERRFSTLLFLAHRAFSEPLCLSALLVMPKTDTPVKHFFRFLLTFSSLFYQKGHFIDFFACLFSKTIIFAFLEHFFSFWKLLCRIGVGFSSVVV